MMIPKVTLTSRNRRRRRSQRQAAVARPTRPAIAKRYRSTRQRAALVWVILMLGVVALGGRLAYLQLVQGESLTQIARQQQAIVQIPRQTRRSIVDRQNNVLAVDRMVFTLYAHPALFKQDRQAVAEALSPVIEDSSADLLSQFRQQETGIQVSRNLSEEIADRIRALRLDGLELIPQQQRFYPQQSLFAPVVGFVNLEGNPQAGLEMALQDQLLLPQAAKAATDVKPTVASEQPTDAEESAETADPGSTSPASTTAANPPNSTAGTVGLATNADYSLQLTLDGRLQRVAQQELQKTVAQHGAKRGTAMVMDARDGSLLAMAVVPTYDPNEYYNADLESFKNWAVSDLYEPGSTFKPINVAIALEVGAISPDDTVYDQGQLKYGKWTIRNADYQSAGGRGTITISQVLQYSSNVGMVHVMDRLQDSTYYDWLQRIGLGHPTGIDLPAEVSGHLKNREQFINSAVESATTAFGQGFSLTPVQLLQLEGAIANGGKLVTPHVVRGLVDDQGDLRWQPQRPNPQPLFSAETTQQVVGMMEDVVAKGTGKPAQMPGYRIAGKTGTAQKAVAGGVYGKGRITSFVAILPAEAPRYVVLAVIDEPKGENAYGSTVAAPLVKTINESLVVLEGVAPATESESAE